MKRSAAPPTGGSTMGLHMTSGSTLSAKSSLLNAGSLRDMLGFGSKRKNQKGGVKTLAATAELDDFIKSIIQEEIGSNPIRPVRRAGGGKRSGNKPKIPPSSFVMDNTESNAERAKAAILSRNNMELVGAVFGLAGADVAYVERQVALAKRVELSVEAKLVQGYEELCRGTSSRHSQMEGDDEEAILVFNIDHARLLAHFACLEFEDDAFAAICVQSEVQTSHSPLSPEDQSLSQSLSPPPLDFNAWMRAVMARVRTRLFAGVFSERRGEALAGFLHKEIEALAVFPSVLAAAADLHTSIMAMDNNEQEQSESFAQLDETAIADHRLRTQNNIDDVHATFGDTTLGDGDVAPVSEEIVDMNSVTATVGSQSVARPEVPPLPVSELPRARSLPSMQQLPHQQQLAAPPGFLLTAKPLARHKPSQAHQNHQLPTLKITKSMLKQQTKRRLMATGGFDEFLGRSTPRVLQQQQQPRHDHSDNIAVTHNQASIQVLRAELKLAQDSLQLLSGLVDDGVVWVHSHCHTTNNMSNTNLIPISGHAKERCRRLAVEKLVNALTNAETEKIRRYFHMWHKGARYVAAQAHAHRFARAKAVQKLSVVLCNAFAVQVRRAWAPWVRAVQIQVFWERHAAVCEMQRVVRGFLGVRRVKSVRCRRAAVVIQCLVRCVQARKKVRRVRGVLELRRKEEAARRMQAWLHGQKQIADAKGEAARRREVKASVKLQTVYRGHQGRKRFAKIKVAQQDQVQVSSPVQEQEILQKRDNDAKASPSYKTNNNAETSEAKRLAEQQQRQQQLRQQKEREKQEKLEKQEKEERERARQAEAKRQKLLADAEEKEKKKREQEDAARIKREQQQQQQEAKRREKEEKEREMEREREERERLQQLEKAEKKSTIAAASERLAEVIPTQTETEDLKDLDAGAEAAVVRIQAVTRGKLGRKAASGIKDGKRKNVVSHFSQLQSQTQVSQSQSQSRPTTVSAKDTKPATPKAAASAPSSLQQQSSESSKPLTANGQKKATNAENNGAEARRQSSAAATSSSSSSSSKQQPQLQSQVSNSAIPVATATVTQPPKSQQKSRPATANVPTIKTSTNTDTDNTMQSSRPVTPATTAKAVDTIASDSANGDGSLDDNQHQQTLILEQEQDLPEMSRSSDRPASSKSNSNINSNSYAKGDLSRPQSSNRPQSAQSESQPDDNEPQLQQPIAAARGVIENENESEGEQEEEPLEVDRYDVDDALPSQSQSQPQSQPDATPISRPGSGIGKRLASFSFGQQRPHTTQSSSRDGPAGPNTNTETNGITSINTNRPSSTSSMARRLSSSFSGLGNMFGNTNNNAKSPSRQQSSTAAIEEELSVSMPVPDSGAAVANNRDSDNANTNTITNTGNNASNNNTETVTAASLARPSSAANMSRPLSRLGSMFGSPLAASSSDLRSKLAQSLSSVASQLDLTGANNNGNSSNSNNNSSHSAKQKDKATPVSQPTSSSRPRKPPPSSPDEAALRIQLSLFRVRKATRRVEKLRQRVKAEHCRAGELLRWAVIRIQAIARAKIGRRKARARLLTYKKDLADRQLHAAVAMQSLVRGGLGRKRMRKLKAAREEERKLAQWSKYGPSKDKGKGKGKAKGKKTGSSKASKSQNNADGFDGDNEQDDGDNDNDDKMRALEEKMLRMEQLEKVMAEKERRMAEAAKLSEERAAAMERALKELDDRMKAEEADKAARQNLLAMAAGPLSSYRSQMNTGRSQLNTGRSQYPDNPPTARSARDGIPPDAPKVVHAGKTWVQLWDPQEQAHYWYCAKTQEAQWGRPDEPSTQDSMYGSGYGSGSGYESAGGMTDYSTDYESGNDYYSDGGNGGGGAGGQWGEYWDEQAQSKYWYNAQTGEATWTKPPELSARGSVHSGSGTSSMPPSARSGAGAGDWISYIDDATGQEYWYNSKTGETSWA